MKQETIDRIRKFTEDRDWEQFHTPANLAKSISIDALREVSDTEVSNLGLDVDKY